MSNLYVRVFDILIQNIKIRKAKANMGGQQSKQGNNDKDQIPKVNHPRFNNIRFTRNKQDEDCIQVKLPVANQKQYNQWVSSLKDAPTNTQDFLLPQHHQFQKEGFCGSSGYAKILFDNFPYVLADQIRNRACLKQKYFDQPELWYLIYTLISAGHEFHKNGKKVGDVRPQNVFINEDGQVKVATHLTWPSQNTNYHKTFYEKQCTYLAPQQLKDIQFAKMQPSCNPQLAQSFSIGLTCLDAGILSNSAQLYLKNNKFNYNQLSAKINQLRNAGYSQVLCLIVGNLCDPDNQKRSTCSELYQWLDPYQEAIINLERFEPTSFPQKIYNSGLGEQFPSPGQGIQGSVRPIPQGEIVTYGGGGNYQNLPPQHIPQGQTVTYIRQSGQVPIPPPNAPQTYVNTHNSSTPYGGGQTVTYYNPSTVVRQVPQGGNYPIQDQRTVIYQQPPSSLPNYPQYQVRQVPVSNQNKTTTSTYTYTQSTGNVPQGGQNVVYPNGAQYTTQNVQYTRTIPPPGFSNVDTTTADRQKSNIELTLQKIDQQLQMSRKMFPS